MIVFCRYANESNFVEYSCFLCLCNDVKPGQLFELISDVYVFLSTDSLGQLEAIHVPELIHVANN
jgi:hypothetical protein